MTTYRADIDGLRAVAVLAVVLYHMHAPLLPGGFTGVDVFFVISGYLITGLIAKEVAAGDFSIARFYVRRAKRILPALFTVLAGTTLLSLVLLTPTELHLMGRSMAATAAFWSNVMFWRDVNYFDTASELKPLLHTWSLSVEEQFYVFWPVVLILVAKFRLPLRVLLFAGLAGSFLLSCYAAIAHPPSAFFLLPARAWELLLGAALALGLIWVPKTPRSRDVTAVSGLLLIAAGIAVLNKDSVFPGWNALLPSVGAMLVIAAGETGSNQVAGRLLGLRPMIFVGLISYSLYLWHWPLLALGRIAGRGDLAAEHAAIIVGISILLSVATWRFIERPFRAGRHTPAATPVLIRYALASGVVLALGVFMQRTDLFERMASPELRRAEAARFDVNPLSGACLRWQSDSGPLPTDRCTTGNTAASRQLVVWGDSHADAIAPAFVAEAGADFSVLQLTMAGCPPLLGVKVVTSTTRYDPCELHNRNVLNYIRTNPQVDVVALSARWPLYAEASRFGDDPGPVMYLVSGEATELSIDQSRQALRTGLTATLDAVQAANKRIILTGSIPALGFNLPDCLARNEMPWSGHDDCQPDNAAVTTRFSYSDTEIASITAGRTNVCVTYPSQGLCPNGQCRVEDGDDVLYANDDHVSLRGALFLSKFFDFDRCLAAAHDQAASQ